MSASYVKGVYRDKTEFDPFIADSMEKKDYQVYRFHYICLPAGNVFTLTISDVLLPTDVLAVTVTL